MKKRILAVICLVLTFAVALVSCGSDTECEHTFSEAWANDAENHWHAATCEHGEVKDSLAKHVDADEDETVAVETTVPDESEELVIEDDDDGIK